MSRGFIFWLEKENHGGTEGTEEYRDVCYYLLSFVPFVLKENHGGAENTQGHRETGCCFCGSKTTKREFKLASIKLYWDVIIRSLNS